MAGVPVRVEQVVVSYEANCSVTISVVTAPGAAAKMIDVTGRNSSSEVSTADTEAEAQAAEDAAERAVKKLVPAVR
jgi:predicted ATP-grasp superfamily ATP-dependent carboligase